MIQKIFAVILVVAAIVGMIFVVLKERNESCEGGKPGDGCPHCPLRENCKKKQK